MKLFIQDAAHAAATVVRRTASALVLALVLAPACSAEAAPEQDWTRTETRDDCADYDPLRQPFFGETHIHTAYSMDALFVRTRTDPRDAYVFAKGGLLDLPPYDAGGVALRTGQLQRPLDFTAITDHSEAFGEAVHCLTEGLEGYNHSLCQGLRDVIAREFVGAPAEIPQEFVNLLLPLSIASPNHLPFCGPDDEYCLREASLIWQDTQEAAEEHYDRTDTCNFTTFNAYEWTYQPNQANQHRNVIFRNDAVPALPISAVDANTPSELWDMLEAACTDGEPGCEFLTIPHNPNVSNGLMFATTQYDGTPWDTASAERRARVEPLVEMVQHKGESECRLGVGGSTDEECGFEKLRRLTLFSEYTEELPPARSYVREGLKQGLRIERDLGTNPYRVGMIGATDGHSSAAGATEEEDHAVIGHQGILDSLPDSMVSPYGPSGIQTNPGGLAVLWAEENSRDALFAAMQRREAYATSGTRPIVRFFAGRIPEDLCSDPEYVDKAYDAGVPMGGVLAPVNGKKSPTFTVLAQKDSATGASDLQKVEIVKLWIGKDRLAREEVITIAGDGDNGASVNTDTCEQIGTGAESLCTVWSDPNFRIEQRALYYARVIENPTCRWSTYVCNDAGVDCEGEVIPEGFEECCNPVWSRTVKERAYTSPIFYTPENIGLAKAKLRFEESPLGRLQAQVLVGLAPRDLDPAANDITIELGDDAPAWTGTIPAGTLEEKKAGRKWLLKDPDGANDGIRKLILVVNGKGTTKLKFDARDIDVSGIPAADGDLALRVASGDFDSTDTRPWILDGSSLASVR